MIGVFEPTSSARKPEPIGDVPIIEDFKGTLMNMCKLEINNLALVDPNGNVIWKNKSPYFVRPNQTKNSAEQEIFKRVKVEKTYESFHLLPRQLKPLYNQLRQGNLTAAAVTIQSYKSKKQSQQVKDALTLAQEVLTEYTTKFMEELEQLISSGKIGEAYLKTSEVLAKARRLKSPFIEKLKAIYKEYKSHAQVKAQKKAKKIFDNAVKLLGQNKIAVAEKYLEAIKKMKTKNYYTYQAQKILDSLSK